MDLADVARVSGRLIDEVEKAVIGKRAALELLLLGRARRRARAARGLPRAREDADGALVRAGLLDGLLAHPVHARPDAVRRHRLVDLQPAHVRLRVPAGADLREPPPRGRDQPRSAEDAGRAARGDAGAAGDNRRRDPAARPAVPRARDPEPDRVRGHLPVAGGAARPVPAAHVGRLPRTRRRMADARRPRGAAAPTRWS